RRESQLPFFLGCAISAIILLLLSANGFTLLIFWEAMALIVFIAMCLEHEKSEVREAGLQYLVASHVTTLSLFVMFSLLSQNVGQQFPWAGSLAPSGITAAAILLTALGGFGIKAGIMPLHVWLPT